MIKLHHIILSLSIITVSCFAQNNAIDDLKRGANILARQFLHQQQMHKAKTMAKFITIIDENNPENKTLINSISDNMKLRSYEWLDDDGIAYSDFLLDLLKILPDNEQTKEKKMYGYYICSVLNPNGPAKSMLPKGMDFSKFYSDLFEESKMVVTNKKDAPTAARDTIINTLNYNPSELLQAINAINYQLRSSGTQINIESKKVKINYVDNDNGYNILEGPPIKAADKNILLKDITVIDFLRYLEHTTSLTYKIGEESILITDAVNGSNGRPEVFKVAKSISEDIQRSLIKSRSTYDNKKIQIKGTVTQIKDAGATFLLEIDNIFVVVVDKKNFKNQSVETITEKFTEYDAAQKDGMLKIVNANKPFLELVVRGECQIKKINQIYINNCDSLLAENLGLFYTK
ncbi:MAG: hypothetical protein NE328_07450 [Lentisphaeraceae bacterium]|nr:hypothetical protein [Lentisphaeraceae bacterium]